MYLIADLKKFEYFHGINISSETVFGDKFEWAQNAVLLSGPGLVQGFLELKKILMMKVTIITTLFHCKIFP